MVLEEIISVYNPWCCLQQPAHPAAELNVSFRMLLAALDQGWNVVESVRPIPVGHDRRKMIHLTLAHETSGQTHQLLVAATPEVERFLSYNDYAI